MIIERVGNLCQQIRGVSYNGDESIDSPREVYLPILRANNITDQGLVYNDLVFVPENRISRNQLLKSGDIVVAAFSGSIQVVGKTGRVLEEWNGSFGAFCKVLRPKS